MSQTPTLLASSKPIGNSQAHLTDGSVDRSDRRKRPRCVDELLRVEIPYEQVIAPPQRLSPVPQIAVQPWRAPTRCCLEVPAMASTGQRHACQANALESNV